MQNINEKIKLDEWFELISQSYFNSLTSYNGKVLPAFPPDIIQLNTTGQSGVSTLQEAFVFYKDCINTFESFGNPITESAQLLDFGVGWGRISRFFLRDLPLENIHGIDVTREFTAICRETFRSQSFFHCQSLPPTELPDNNYNFIVGYSVFSHLSESACLAWMREFNRILRPGGIVALTTRGRPFFDFCEEQKKLQSGWRFLLGRFFKAKKPIGYLEALGLIFEDFAEARAKYDRGQFVHSNIEGVNGGGSLDSTFYGETFIPEAYARSAYEPYFKLEKFMYESKYQSHPIMFFRKR